MAKSRSSSGLVFLIIVIAAAAGGWYYWKSHQDKGPEYFTATASRGEVVESITATGIIQPFLDVLVSSQISGYVNGLFVDFNSKVKKGDILATLLPTNYEAALKSAKGDLANSQANYELHKINLKRDKELLAKNLMAQSDYDSESALVDEAAAQVQIKSASLDTASANLSYCQIRSPIDGFIIKRAIDIGNSVAASLSSPTLFEIGNDLTKMQIDASVAEADIGNVEVNQDVIFTVDTYPNRQFHGKVYQIRNAPQTQQNVVIYDVMISVANDDLKLKPGMTANVQIVVARKPDVVRIANSALRFRMPEALMPPLPPAAKAPDGTTPPAAKTVSPEDRRKQMRQLMQDVGYTRGSGPMTPDIIKKVQALAKERGIELPDTFGNARGATAGAGDAPVARTIYRLASDAPGAAVEAVRVHLGITDGSDTEIVDGLKAGDIVVTGLTQPVGGPGGGPTGNPFGGGGGRGFGR